MPADNPGSLNARTLLCVWRKDCRRADTVAADECLDLTKVCLEK